MVEVYVGIGSNVDREKNIRGGLQALARRFGKLSLSPVYQCRAYGFHGDDFYNFCASFTTFKEIEQVLAEIKQIEYNFGRRCGEEKFSPRTLDVDLLLYGDVVNETYDIPRDDVSSYAFVIKPMSDMAPNLVHPKTGQTMKTIWDEFKGDKLCISPVQFEFE